MIDLLIGLSSPDGRADAAGNLARRLGVEEVLLFICDSELGAMLPAAGMPQTIRAGPSWRKFLKIAAKDGVHRGEVDLPPGRARPATACTWGQLAVIMLGAEPAAAGLVELEAGLPLLQVVMVNEQKLWLAQIERQQAHELSQRSATLSHALEAARSEAAQLNVQLREEDRLKDQFLAMLAHELRNPLAGVVAAIHVLSRRIGADPAQLKTLTLMKRQCSQLEKLVADLMDVARVSHGRIQLQLDTLILQDVLHASVETNHHALQAKNHTLTLQLPDKALVVNGDTVRLTQVFSNLLHNAIKYTDAGGRITIEAREEDGGVSVNISDNGIGIDSVTLLSVFNMFQQAPVALDRSQGGLGLGLTLVRKLLTLHGGRVEAQSGGPGRGSTFSVWLPAHAVRPVAQTKPPLVQPTAQRLNVLVIDDNADLAEATCELLQALGHSAASAPHGRAGLAEVERGGLDLVLLDLGLPDIDGYEVVRRIRAAGHHSLPVVALTGYGGNEVSQAAREAGFDDHRVKPLSGAELEHVLQKAAAKTPRDR